MYVSRHTEFISVTVNCCTHGALLLNHLRAGLGIAQAFAELLLDSGQLTVLLRGS